MPVSNILLHSPENNIVSTLTIQHARWLSTELIQHQQLTDFKVSFHRPAIPQISIHGYTPTCPSFSLIWLIVALTKSKSTVVWPAITNYL